MHDKNSNLHAKLLSNLSELSKSLTRQDFGLGEDFVIESDNLLTDIILLLLDLGAEIGKVAIAGHFCFILGRGKLNIQLLDLNCDLLNLVLEVLY